MGRAIQTTIKTVAAVLGAACVLGAAGSAAARDRMINAVSEKVQVESRDGKVLVRLIIDNQSERTIYMPRAVAGDQQMLEVRDSSNGDPIDYVGPAIKPRPLGKDDFVAVKPHSRHTHTIDITQSYAFMQGRHTYQLNYAGNYAVDLKNVGQLTPVEPDNALFAYIGK